MALSRKWKIGLAGAAGVAVLGAAATFMVPQDNSTELTESDVTRAATLETMVPWTKEQLAKYQRLTPQFDKMASRQERLSDQDCDQKAVHALVVLQAFSLITIDEALSSALGTPSAIPHRNQLPSSLSLLETMDRYTSSLEKVCGGPEIKIPRNGKELTV